MSESKFTIPSPFEVNLHTAEGKNHFADLLIETEAMMGDRVDYGPYGEFFCELEVLDTKLALALASTLVTRDETRGFVASRLPDIIKAAQEPSLVQEAAELWISILEHDSTDELADWQQTAADMAYYELDPEENPAMASELLEKIDPVLVSRIVTLAHGIDDQSEGKEK